MTGRNGCQALDRLPGPGHTAQRLQMTQGVLGIEGDEVPVGRFCGVEVGQLQRDGAHQEDVNVQMEEATNRIQATRHAERLLQCRHRRSMVGCREGPRRPVGPGTNCPEDLARGLLVEYPFLKATDECLMSGHGVLPGRVQDDMVRLRPDPNRGGIAR